MRKIAIAGAGGFSKEIYLTINDINKVEPQWEFIGFFDDNVPKGQFFLDFEVLGTINHLNQINETTDVIIAAGKSHNIVSIVKKLNSDKLNFPNLMHPSCQFLHFDSLIIGIGNIIQPFSSLSAPSRTAMAPRPVAW